MGRPVAAWAGTALGQLVKTPKLQFIDSGLLAALLEIGDIAPVLQRSRFGPLLESFVFGELLKFCTWSERRYAMSYYRDKSQREVDFVIEDAQGVIVGIEVKSAATVTRRLASADFCAPQNTRWSVFSFHYPLPRMIVRSLEQVTQTKQSIN